MNNKVIKSSTEIYKFAKIHQQKIDSCHRKSSIKKIWQLNFLSKKMIHVKEEVCLRFKLCKNF